jgi:YjbE family integral membrane protein
LEFFNPLDIFTQGGLFALLQVLLIDIVLAGDNAVVIGMSAANVAKADRKTVIFWGLATAVVLRILLAFFAIEMMQFVPLVILGGILLLWVTWRLGRDVWQANKEHHAQKILAGENGHDVSEPACSTLEAKQCHAKLVRRAILSIALADVSMSLDNVLAVAGAAREHKEVLIIGLLLSIALMGAAATLIAKLLHKYPWISYAGVFIVLFVALRMIWEGFERLHNSGWIDGAAHAMGVS